MSWQIPELIGLDTRNDTAKDTDSKKEHESNLAAKRHLQVPEAKCRQKPEDDVGKCIEGFLGRED